MALIREYRDGLCMLYGDHRIFYPISHPYGFIVNVNRFSGDDGMSMDEYGVIQMWCRERFSSDVWFVDDHAFWFKQANDALEFKLRWV
jgi:hypothetical protein